MPTFSRWSIDRFLPYRAPYWTRHLTKKPRAQRSSVVRQRQLNMPTKNAAKREKAEDEQPIEPTRNSTIFAADRQTVQALIQAPEEARTAALGIKSRFSVFAGLHLRHREWVAYRGGLRERCEAVVDGELQYRIKSAAKELSVYPLRANALIVDRRADQVAVAQTVSRISWRQAVQR